MDKLIKVGQIMTTEVITVSPNDTMDKVQKIFRTNNIHHVPVVEEGRVVGILSKTDYMKLLHGFTLFKAHKSEEYNDAIMRSLLVKEAMTRQVATINQDDTVELAAGFFRENLFHALPIVDHKGMLVGIITTFDLLNYAFHTPTLID
jgi:CBS domain-containing protein